MPRLSRVLVFAFLFACHDPVPEPEPGKRVERWYFEINLPPDPPRRIRGCLERRPGPGKSRILVDLDGDGHRETESVRITDPEKIVARNGSPGDVQITVFHGGNRWTLEFMVEGSCGLAPDMTLLMLSWAAERDGVRVRAECCELTGYPSRPRAAEAPRRLGPPFSGRIDTRPWGSRTNIGADCAGAGNGSLEAITENGKDRRAIVSIPDLSPEPLGYGEFG